MKNKLIFKLLILILISAFVAPFFIKDKKGKPLMTMDKIKLPQISLPELPKIFKTAAKKNTQEYKPVETEILSPNIPEPAPGQDVIIIYTYKDEKGISHYTNKKPDLNDYKILYMPVNKGDDENILSKLKEKLTNFTENIKQKQVTPEPVPSPQNDPSDISIPNIYTQPTKAIDDARELKKQVEAKFKEREQMME